MGFPVGAGPYLFDQGVHFLIHVYISGIKDNHMPINNIHKVARGPNLSPFTNIIWE